MASTVQDPESTQIHVGLNNFIARATSPVFDYRTPEYCESGRRTPTERSKYQLWPFGRKCVGSPGRHTPELEQVRELAVSQSSPALRDAAGWQFPPGSKTSFSLKDGLPRRRKICVPELGLEPMTTVQEGHMDSPTIPGKFPVHERSNSAPGASWGKSFFESTVLKPVKEPAILQPETHEEKLEPTEDKPEPAKEEKPDSGDEKKPEKNPEKKLEPSAIEDNDDTRAKSLKRASSTALPEGLAALIATSDEKPPDLPDPATVAQEIKSPGTPPAVPPKSPRMMARMPTANNQKPSLNTNVPGNTTKNIQPCAPITAPAESNRQDPFNLVFKGQSCDTRRDPHSAVGGRGSPSPWISSNISKTNDIKNSPDRRPSRNNTVRPYIYGTPPQMRRMNPNDHKRNHSETSVPIMERSRPKKRNDIAKKRMSKQHASAEDINDQGPFGYPVHDARFLIPRSEIDRLRAQARGQAKRYEILKYTDMKTLSLELRVLEERCEYLRTTYNSLRSGRRSLHTRMITYLKSPRLSKFSRESIVKQEEALSELDTSIDEWLSKWQRAESRRSHIRQKLLEHIAATLVLQTSSQKNYDSSSTLEETSPPRSPEEDDVASLSGTNRRDVESIKIYADAEVCNLFADIERKMEMMVVPKMPNLTPPQEDTTTETMKLADPPKPKPEVVDSKAIAVS